MTQDVKELGWEEVEEGRGVGVGGGGGGGWRHVVNKRI